MLTQFNVSLAMARVCSLIFLVIGSAFFVATVVGQAPRKAHEEEATASYDYRGVHLGMLADDVRKKLGEPKDKGNEQDFFMFGETETAQIVYDKTGKVVTISADFLPLGTTIPTAKQVFGTDVEAKADGSVYKMVRFPKAGYWLSYNRTGGNSPLTTVTLQKIQ